MTRNKMKVASIIIASLIIASGIFGYIYYKPEEKKPEEKPIKQIDDQISPLSQQAVNFEIHRIRRKGIIIDQIMNNGFGTRLINRYVKNLERNKLLDSLIPGFGWDKTPVFSYVAVLDGYESNGRVDYKAWDTGYINNNLYKPIEIWNSEGTGYIGEKENVDIEFKFIEKNKGFLKRTTDKVIESFKVNYDFRTGRWGGSDYLNDSDGYGHFNGSGYEMWFSIYQTDYDNDGIPYWTEVNIIETNPKIDDSKLDPDEDGLQNTEEYFMKKWLSNPLYPEIYILKLIIGIKHHLNHLK